MIHREIHTILSNREKTMDRWKNVLTKQASLANTEYVCKDEINLLSAEH